MIAAAVLACLTSCTPAQRVTVDQQPITLEKFWIEDVEDKSQIPIKPDEEAVTQWKFGCKNDFDFRIVEQTRLADEFMVTIRITSIKSTLTAPIAVYLPKAASDETKKHEDAHVEICKRVYSHAAQVAREAALAMIDRNFQASGKTVEEAVRSAISIANAEVCDDYHLNTGEEVRRVSEILDSLDEHNHTLPLPQLIDLAFGHYTRVSGDTRIPAPPPSNFVDEPSPDKSGKHTTNQTINNQKRQSSQPAQKKAADQKKKEPPDVSQEPSVQSRTTSTKATNKTIK